MEKHNFRIKELTTTKFDKTVIDGLNFDLKKGEIHTVVGASGKDVPSFANIFDGGNNISSGIIEADGRVYNAMELAKWTKQINMIRQIHSLYSNLTIVDNLFLVDKVTFFLTKKHIVRACQDLLDGFDIGLDAECIVRNLSHEQKILIELLKLFVRSKNTIILYETLNYVDYECLFKFQRIVNEMKLRGKSFIYITSRFEDIFKLSDRISFLSNGRISETYLAEEVKKNPTKSMYLMSGWDDLGASRQIEEEQNDIVDTIFKGTEILTSSFELKDALSFIASNLAEEIQAKCCVIYVVDKIANNVIDTIKNSDDEKKRYRLKKEFVETVIKKDADDIFFENCTDSERKRYFELENDTKTLLCVPVVLKTKVIGLIQISYDKYHIYTERDSLYIATMKNEIALAAENSWLMGSSVLLQESHHRIKNNLQIIISLMYMQKKCLKQREKIDIDEFIDTIIYRIKSIAAVHDMLSTNMMNSSIINLKKIVLEIVRLYHSPYVSITSELEDAFMPYNKAASAALVINELINNCFKHAFEPQKAGAVKIICKNEGAVISLVIKDNGVGMDISKKNKKDGLGISIVESIVKGDFGGDIAFTVQNGTAVEIKIPKNAFFN